jgi:transposase InsO family protein
MDFVMDTLANGKRIKCLTVVVDFTRRALDRWAYAQRVDLKLIAAGKPTQNAYIESFNSRFRDECLNDHYFNNLAHARAVIGEWRRDYNEARPHSSIGRYRPPSLQPGIDCRRAMTQHGRRFNLATLEFANQKLVALRGQVSTC